jgi:hypothetical protein
LIQKRRDALRVGGSRCETEERISIPKNTGFCNLVSRGMELVAAILCRIGKCAAIPTITDIARGDSIAEATSLLSCRAEDRFWSGISRFVRSIRQRARRSNGKPAAAVPR